MIIKASVNHTMTIPEEAIEAEEAVSIEYGEKEMTVEIGESHSTTEVAEEVQFPKNEVELDPESIPVGWQHFWKMMKICGVHLPAKLAELDQPYGDLAENSEEAEGLEEDDVILISVALGPSSL